MFKNRRKKYSTVIMDGSNKETVENILRWFDCFTNRRFGKTKCRPLDKNHKTMLVVNVKLYEDSYELLQSSIEKVYPALCVFNPPM